MEGYDADGGTATAQISNLSTRSLAGTGASVLTIGFAITGDASKTVLIRAVGPTLGGFGVAGAVANPQLRLFSSRSNELGFNDDWFPAANWSEAFASVGAFSLGSASRDAALLVSLPAGTYTAQASGVNNTTGVALIEIYDVPAAPAGAFVFRPVENTVPGDFPRAGSIATQATVISQARPAYPFELRRIGATGEALVQLAIGTDGRVTDTVVLRSHDIQFADAAAAAVRQWTFTPARNAAGQPVIQINQVPIIFTLSG
jgi:TonB family protein